MGNDLHMVDFLYSYVSLLEGKIWLRVYRSTPLNQLCMALQPNSRFKGFPSAFQGQQKTANHS